MFCSNCGEKLDDGTKFCIQCGKPVNSGSVQPQIQEQSPIVGTTNDMPHSVSEDQETIIYQLDATFSTGPSILASFGIGPMIITNKRIIMTPKFSDMFGNVSQLNEMEVFWKDISDIKRPKLDSTIGINIQFHFLTKKGKAHNKLLVGHFSGTFINNCPIKSGGKIDKELYNILYQAWIKGR